MQVKGALWFPIINTPVPPPLRPQRLTPLPSPSLTPWPPFPSTLQHPIMSSWCKWLDEKRLFTASLYMHVQKKKQVKWAQSTQRWGVGFASEGSKKNTIYRLLTASLFTCTQKKKQVKQVQSMQGWGLGCEQSEQEEYSPPPTPSSLLFCTGIQFSPHSTTLITIDLITIEGCV